jgi:hypothetical protein
LVLRVQSAPPVLSITGLLAASVAANGADFNLTVSGSGFVNGSAFF